MKTLMLLCIRLYQKTLSPDSGLLRYFKPYGQCKFFPSCSEYTYQAIEKYGIAYGILAGVKRILRCTPWSEGGVDEIENLKIL